jgi:YD repeat-containing protein
MTYDNGVVTTYSYDAASRLTNMLTRNSQPVTLNSYTYIYDEVGNREE